MAAGLMVADHRQHRLAAIRDGIATLAYPIQWAVQTPVRFDDKRAFLPARAKAALQVSPGDKLSIIPFA